MRLSPLERLVGALTESEGDATLGLLLDQLDDEMSIPIILQWARGCSLRREDIATALEGEPF